MVQTLAAAAMSLGFCPATHAEAPMNYLQAFGTKAEQILPLTWGLIVISVVVVTIVAALLLWGLIVAPKIEPDRVGMMPVERPMGGLSWLYIGVGLSTLVLFISAAWTMVTLAAVGEPPQRPAFTVEVTGHQWWWQVRYLDESPSRIFTTANEIHIPVGKPVMVRLATADVIHSFWVPALTGKTDLVPGQTNVTWIEATKPGVYRGQCSEFCGAQHAHMAVLVLATAEKEFEDWRDAQLSAAPSPSTVLAENGEQTFRLRCGACHAVRGTSAGGILGPDLSHLMQRRTIAAGTLPNTTGNLAGWIADPQGIKPGSAMPRPELSSAELQHVIAYLQTLK
jgi:cytochrome c oxidase subunit II